MLSPPKSATPYVGRDKDAEEALTSTFKRIILLAQQYGWEPHETAAALQANIVKQFEEDAARLSRSPEIGSLQTRH